MRRIFILAIAVAFAAALPAQQTGGAGAANDSGAKQPAAFSPASSASSSSSADSQANAQNANAQGAAGQSSSGTQAGNTAQSNGTEPASSTPAPSPATPDNANAPAQPSSNAGKANTSTASEPSTTEAASAAPSVHGALTNADVIKMVKGGLQEATVIGAIQANKTHFDVSADGLLSLKQAGVSDKVITAVLESAARDNANADTADTAEHAHAMIPPEPPAKPVAAPATANTSATQASAAPAAQTRATLPVPANPAASTPGNGMAANPANSAAMAAMMAQMQAQQMMMSEMANMSPQARAQMMRMLGGRGMGAMGLTGGGMAGMGMNGMPVAADELPKVELIDSGERQPMQAAFAQVASARTKGGGGGGMGVAPQLASFGSEALSFAAFAGPAGMAAAPVLGLASGLTGGLLGHHSSTPVTTYVWALPGPNSSNVMQLSLPSFEIQFANLVGVDPDEFEPAVVHLIQTRDNFRLVGASKVKMDPKKGELRSPIGEERVPISVTKLGRGHFQIATTAPLEPGEYGIVVHPIKRKARAVSSYATEAQEAIFYSVWDFSVGQPSVESTIGKKKNKHKYPKHAS